MARSINTERLDEITRQVGERSLVPGGFSLRGHTFRKTIEPGFVHIVDFGLGPAWSTRHGSFTVDACVFIGEVYSVLFDTHVPRLPTSMHCELRQRLSLLADPPSDRWWSLGEPIEPTVAEVRADIDKLGLPFLDLLSGRKALVAEWSNRGSDSLGLSPRGDLCVAIVLKEIGEESAARELLNSAIAAAVGQRTELFVRKIASTLIPDQSLAPAEI